MCGGEWFICMWVCGDDRIALGVISQACFFSPGACQIV